MSKKSKVAMEIIGDIVGVLMVATILIGIPVTCGLMIRGFSWAAGCTPSP